MAEAADRMDVRKRYTDTMLSLKHRVGNILSALEVYPMTSVVKVFCKHNNAGAKSRCQRLFTVYYYWLVC
jgi:hypothetical protein